MKQPFSCSFLHNYSVCVYWTHQMPYIDAFYVAMIMFNIIRGIFRFFQTNLVELILDVVQMDRMVSAHIKAHLC